MGTIKTYQNILGQGEGPAAEVVNPLGSAPIVLVCEHGSAFIPRALSDLGLREAAKLSHVAWDPGAMAVARRMSEFLNAPLVASRVSRLVYDCNRPPESSAATPAISEVFDIPGNKQLTELERHARAREIYEPFRALLDQTIANAAAPTPALVTLHSFTPTYFGKPRHVELGLLHDADDRLALAMLNASMDISVIRTELNAPYDASDGVTHTLVEHALPKGLLNVMIEIRNDLITREEDVDRVADSLCKMIVRGLKQCDPATFAALA
jgi:predicted N-formylglutamate amidohydrolase